MEGNWNGAQGNNKYQYNEKEWNDDFGLGWNDYGARMYDPAMSRWVAVDPFAYKYFTYSPYSNISAKLKKCKVLVINVLLKMFEAIIIKNRGVNCPSLFLIC